MALTYLCEYCKLYKELSEYYIRSDSKARNKKCKQCVIKESKRYRDNNSDKIKEYYIKNKERQSIYSKNRRKANPELFKQKRAKIAEKQKSYFREYRQKNKKIINEKLKEYQKNRRKKDPLFKMRQYIGSRIKIAFTATGNRKCTKTEELLGCTIIELKIHLESKMINGMNWDNYGYYGWHIDHKMPLSSAKTEEELIKLCHYTNLQPLWRLDNQVKGSCGYRNPFKNKIT